GEREGKSRSPSCPSKKRRDKDGAPRSASSGKFAILVSGARRAQADAATSLADGGAGVGGGEACVAAYAAAFLRDAHGGERCGFAHGANNSWALGYFDYAGVHTYGAGSAADGVSEVSSAGEGEVGAIADFRL